jgi:hypothetical protein
MGDVRDHVIDEMGGELAHPSTAAGRAEPPPFATERDDGRVPAAVTPPTQESVVDDPTPEIGLELASDERRPSTGPVFSRRAPEECRQVCRDGPVEHSLLGPAALVSRGRGTRPSHAGRREHTPCPEASALWSVVSTETCPSRAGSGRRCHRPRPDIRRAGWWTPLPLPLLGDPPPTKGFAPRSLGTAADAPGDRSAVDVETDLSQPAHRRKAARPGTSCDAATSQRRPPRRPAMSGLRLISQRVLPGRGQSPS